MMRRIKDDKLTLLEVFTISMFLLVFGLLVVASRLYNLLGRKKDDVGTYL